MGGSFGPLVVDEKDIGITSAHIMTIMISIFFYCIEVAISSLWISLHNSHDILDDHASYYTGKPAYPGPERNSLTATPNRKPGSDTIFQFTNETIN